MFDKSSEEEQPIPNIWRNTFSLIVSAIKNKDFNELNEIQNFKPIEIEDFNLIIDNIHGYGCELTDLPIETWKSSVCILDRENAWTTIVDLYSVEEGRSDLILHTIVFEKENNAYLFEIINVYVP